MNCSELQIPRLRHVGPGVLQDLTPQQVPGLHPVIRWRFPRLNIVLVTVTDRRTGRALPWVWVGFAARCVRNKLSSRGSGPLRLQVRVVACVLSQSPVLRGRRLSAEDLCAPTGADRREDGHDPGRPIAHGSRQAPSHHRRPV